MKSAHCVLGLSLLLAAGVPGLASGADEVSGKMTVDGKSVAISHAYLDVTDPTEPIVVLSDKPLPPTAIPFIPEKLARDQGLTAVGFSYSQKDEKLTNTYGRLQCPGHEDGVGFGRVEEGAVSLTVKRLDSNGIEGTFATTKPVKMSYISYSFALKFRVAAPPAKK
jgi:hypothetical protein